MLNTRMSALMDGEVNEAETHEVLAAIKDDATMRVEWASFHLIGAAMRQEHGLDVDIAASVMRALEAEPTVLAPVFSRYPASHSRNGFMRPLLALAASAAGVAVVAWVALGDGPSVLPGSVSPMAAAVATATSVATVPGEAALTPLDRGKELRDYLLAHHAHAPVVTMAEGTRYVRTVSLEREKH